MFSRPVEEIYEDEVDAVVVHGDRLDDLQGWEWDTILSKSEIVFARTSPKHKLEIVRRAQALGHVVGVVSYLSLREVRNEGAVILLLPRCPDWRWCQ